MGPKRRKHIPEEALAFIHQVACIHMNLSDAYLYLTYLYNDEKSGFGFGAYSRDKATVKWFYAKSILKCIIERGSKVCIPEIQRPEIDTQGCIECVTAVLNMERELTKTLKNLYELASNIKDRHTLRFARELIHRQRRDEDRLIREIDKLNPRDEEEEDEEIKLLREQGVEVYQEVIPRKMPRR
ncbi:ferritin, heavy subunit-like [Grammomys surdaster]|uniref:ferritin, heavy subunit-like n=1 Tax=Grammomys surdaster TaxID=491861 RepID=UPI0010A066F1|nr:ferritin, heavy subunit-like [Grammomys surdaster]